MQRALAPLSWDACPHHDDVVARRAYIRPTRGGRPRRRGPVRRHWRKAVRAACRCPRMLEVIPLQRDSTPERPHKRCARI